MIAKNSKIALKDIARDLPLSLNLSTIEPILIFKIIISTSRLMKII